MTSDAVTSDAVLRRVRVLTLPSVLFASGLAGHAAAHGSIPTPSVLVPLFVLTVAVAAPFAGARTSPAGAVALLAGGQALLHAAFQVLGGSAGMVTTTPCGATYGMAAMPPSSHHAMHHCAAPSPGSALTGMSDGHLVMLLTHVAAAVVVGAWLVAGERAFWTLLALTARPVVEAWRSVIGMVRGGVGPVPNRPRLELGWGPLSRVRDVMWATGVLTRRGPPASCCAA
jgi:hypothetical protein